MNRHIQLHELNGRYIEGLPQALELAYDLCCTMMRFVLPACLLTLSIIGENRNVKSLYRTRLVQDFWTVRSGQYHDMGVDTVESHACDQCFRRKQGCSKTRPQCHRCAATLTPCTYSFGKFMGKPKKSIQAKKQRQAQSSSKANGHESTSSRASSNDFDDHDAHGSSR